MPEMKRPLCLAGVSENGRKQYIKRYVRGFVFKPSCRMLMELSLFVGVGKVPNAVRDQAMRRDPKWATFNKA